jgi:UDP-3-O-[3-hydroxymyristoyl] glucosamine N-acyltransferase
VVIEDDVEIGAATAIDRAKFGETRIGRGTKIDNLVQIGHNVRIGPCCIVVAGAMIAGSVELSAGAIIGGGAGIVEHVRMGNQSRLAAMSCAWGDVADGVTVSGIPAREHKQNLRVDAMTQRLPELRAQLKALADRIDKLEAAANHRQVL